MEAKVNPQTVTIANKPTLPMKGRKPWRQTGQQVGILRDREGRSGMMIVHSPACIAL